MRRGLAAVALVVLLTGCAGTGAGPDARAAGTPPSVGSSPSAGASSSRPAPAPRPSPVPAAADPAPVVVLDPGHNGGNAAHPEVIGVPVPDGDGGTKPCNTTGTATDAGYPEHAFAWDVAVRVRAELAAAGMVVVLTRPDDAGVGPCVDARGRLAGRVGAAAFLSIHGDGAPPGGRGFHVITSSLDPAGPAVGAASRRLAATVRDAMTAVLPVSSYLGADGLDARRDLAGLNLNAAPAVYAECGNMRNATDAALMSSPQGRQAIADRLATALRRFLGR